MGVNHRNHSSRGVRAAAAALTMAGAASFFLAAASAASAATLNGTATVTDPTTNAPLESGGSATVFTLDLPAQAACSGDTANDGYHVFSYLLAPATAVTTDDFSSGFPSEGLGLFDSKGYYGSASTAPTTAEIIDIPPDFQWAYLLSHGQTAADLDGGSSQTWDTGLACANPAGTVTDYWNAEVTFTASASDPDGFVWGLPTVPGAPTSPTAVQGKKSISVTWTDPTDNGGTPITGYDVYCATTDPPPTTGTPTVTVSGATASSATVTAIKKATTYYCVVTAVNAQGQSPASPVAARPPDTTKTAVTCKPKKVASGKSTTCTAKVTDATTASDTPTGTVSWSGGSDTFAPTTCALSAGRCSVTYTPSSAGTQTISARFAGTSTQAASTGSLKLKVT